ncbi:hypothetical protein IQ268_08620 [Oculatella sp. LEGE 06141]|uniref:hypothetical protein n=1 Tax=Oculatella sp. LEGE 06141 TaxID=1828648 RepID=UPI00187E1909|nr:hypothetical protein [Oculatella sp. LEGE 06141]MBE9178621.1 hypothetical protein [Oculatella sp. LEGE 06141]
MEVQHIDLALVGSIKSKLRYWLADRVGICLHDHKAVEVVELLIRTATAIRYCAAHQIEIEAPPAEDESLKAGLWRWMFAHIPATTEAVALLPWANALEEMGQEIKRTTLV